MKLYIIVLFKSIIFFSSTNAYTQDFGLSFSYFIPKNGYFSIPISPFSIRGVGFDFGRHLSLEGGFSLYRMSGLNVKNMGKLTLKKPALGPNFTIFVPLHLNFNLINPQFEFKIKTGGFVFFTFDNRLMYGNIDQAIREYENWDVANVTLNFQNNIGLGYLIGLDYLVFIKNNIGVGLEMNYLIGSANFPINGEYSGGNFSTGLEKKKVKFKDSKIDYSGLEFSINIVIRR